MRLVVNGTRREIDEAPVGVVWMGRDELSRFFYFSR